MKLLQSYMSSPRRKIDQNTLKKESDRATASLLPALSQAKYEAGLDKEKLDLEKQSLAQSETDMLRDFNLSKDAQAEAKKQNKISTGISAGKLGLDAYFGFKNKDNVSDIVFGETGKAAGSVAKPAGEFMTKSDSNILSGVTDTKRLIGSGVGAAAGALASDWIADKTGIDESTAAIAAPIAGAVIGNYAAPIVTKAATDYLAPAWSKITSWFGW